MPVLDDHQLSAAEGTFDVVTSVEVIEHVPDPISWLRRIRRLLRPGGVFYFTTGNTARYRRPETFLRWSYVVPDLHVSYFDPSNAAMALRAAGFTPEPLGWRPGCANIIRSRALKNLRVHQRAAWEHLVPWSIASPLLNRAYGVFDFPIGRV